MRPGTIVFGLTSRRAVRSGALWGLLAGLVNAGSVSGYTSAYATEAARARLADSFSGNVGLAALLGVPHDLDTVGGFVAWRAVGALGMVAAIWGLLAATRALRGEEDAGRWQLLVAGQTTRRGATRQALAGLAVGLAAFWAVDALVTAAASLSSDGRISTTAALWLATTVTASAALFAAVGALTSQLAPSRRHATALGASALGAAYLVRMLADSNPNRAWIRWCTPLGWVENLRPMSGSQLAPVLPIVTTVAALAAITLALASGRDVEAAALRSSAGRSRPGLVSGTTLLAARLTSALTGGWLVALAALGFVGGMVGQDAARAYEGSETVDRVLGRLGASGGDASIVGVVFLAAAALLAVLAAGHVSAACDEETTGVLDHLLSRPVERWRWLLGRAAVALVGIVVGALALGFGAWVGAAGTASGLGVGALLEASLSVVAPAVFVLAAGLLAIGEMPRWAVAVAYSLVVWSFVVEFVTTVVRGNRFLLDTSLLHHVAPAPAADPNWTAAAVMLGLSAAVGALGVAAFGRRDLLSA
jgi:ABC-2 type transport system permease protein